MAGQRGPGAVFALTDPAPVPATAPFHQVLRSATQPDHEAVDDAFSRFDLQQPAGYAAFLTAHARCLPVLERGLIDSGLLEPARARSSRLEQDLSDLGFAMPSPLPGIAIGAGAGAWGTLYVVEGSRLGGVMLSRRLHPNVPARYLRAAHSANEWRMLLLSLDRQADSPQWRNAVIGAARATFRSYRDAAAPAIAPTGQMA